MARPPALFVMGPTATGKTDLAVALHDRLPVEIISVDSVLVYRGMDIGTAKPDPALRARVPHHLIDIRDPSEPYSAADFLRDAVALMADITRRGRIPLLVGGTMLYFRVLLEGLADLPPSDRRVRGRILAEAETVGWPEMHRRLAEVDPESAAVIHPNHSQRIQRTLEIYQITGKPASHLRAEQGCQGVAKDYNIVQIVLLPRDRSLLHRRIAERFHRMLELGLVSEVKRLYDRGDLDRNLPAIRSVGYRQVWDYLEGELAEDELEARAVAATRQLAKRQLTWLRGWPDLREIFIDEGGGRILSPEELLKLALKFLDSCPIY